MKKYNTIFISLLTAAFMANSCGIDIDSYKEVNPDGGEELLLTASPQETIVLNERESSATALELSWTTGSNFGTGNAIDYRLEMGQGEGDWAAVYAEDLGRNIFSRSISVEELNGILTDEFNANHGVSGTYKVRLTASVYDRPDLMQTSECTFTATTYQPAPSELYIIGDVTEGGWDADAATQMTRSRAAVFTYEGLMQKDASFRFITTPGSAYPSYIRTAGSETAMEYSETEPANTSDINFVIPETSIYRITANLLDLEVTLQDILTGTLYLIGDATPGGWDLSALSEMESTAKGIFTWTGVLRSGGEGFKFVTGRSFWPGYVKAVADVSDMTIKYAESELPAAEDLKFAIAEDATYEVKADLLNLTVTVTRVGDAPYTALWLIGNASPVGWSLDDAAGSDAAKMTPLESDSEIFTWTGDLAAGEFKISCDLKRDWAGKWYMPTTGGKPLTVTASEPINLIDASTPGSPDNKWTLTAETAGNYTLTVNTRTSTMTVVRNN